MNWFFRLTPFLDRWRKPLRFESGAEFLEWLRKQ